MDHEKRSLSPRPNIRGVRPDELSEAFGCEPELFPEKTSLLGALPPRASPKIAIVGTRRSDPEAEDFIESLAAELALAGATIISGGALGIDAAAHRGALMARGATVAILASGLGRPYPRQNKPLFDEIARSGGALLSAYAAKAPPTKFRFHARNRLIAGVSDAVIVAQAPRRSGALSTAESARRLGKPLYIVPSAPWDPLAEGSLRLLERGAKICIKAADVLSLAQKLPTNAADNGGGGREKTLENQALDDLHRAVLGALSRRPVHIDELGRTLGLPIEDVQYALFGLILMGLAEERHHGVYLLARRAPPSYR